MYRSLVIILALLLWAVLITYLMSGSVMVSIAVFLTLFVVAPFFLYDLYWIFMKRYRYGLLPLKFKSFSEIHKYLVYRSLQDSACAYRLWLSPNLSPGNSFYFYSKKKCHYVFSSNLLKVNEQERFFEIQTKLDQHAQNYEQLSEKHRKCLYSVQKFWWVLILTLTPFFGFLNMCYKALFPNKIYRNFSLSFYLARVFKHLCFKQRFSSSLVPDLMAKPKSSFILWDSWSTWGGESL